MPPEENTNGQGEPKYSFVREDVRTKLDPELQRVVIAIRQGQRLPPHLLEEIEVDGKTKKVVDVVARLRNPSKQVPGLWVVQKIGRVVTGMVEADRITEVRGDKNVLSLKAARRLRKMLIDSVPEIDATRENLQNAFPDGHAPVDGSRVIVGFVDHGCDFAHPNFRKRDEAGTTRVLYLWDQRGGKTKLSPKHYGYGREFNARMINRALAEAPPIEGDPDRPHRRLGYIIKSGNKVFGHGTRVMDVAVGNGGGQNAPGVAPGADIIFVDSSLGDFDNDESAGNSRHLLEAVKYIFDKADKLGRPAVVNISLNFDGGPHDGSTPVEEGFDRLLESSGRAIVIAAGNSRTTGIHLKRTIRPGRTNTLLWGIDEDDRTTNKLEIWYDGRHRLEVALCSPGGQELGPFPPDTTYTIYNGKKVAGRVFNRLRDPANRDNQIVLLFDLPMNPGVWKIELRAVDRMHPAPFDVHAWIEKDEKDGGKPSTFQDVGTADSSYTVGTIACGHSTIVVGGYEKLNLHSNMISSAEGPTRDGKLKPEVSAPGVGSLVGSSEVPLRVAEALTTSVKETPGGTSIAAPHVAGVVALLMDAALLDAGKFLSVEETRDLIIKAARNNPPADRNTWDTCFGAGRVSAADSVKALVEAGKPTPVVEEYHELLAVAEATVVFTPSGGAGPHLGSSEGGVVAASVVTTVAVSSFSEAPQGASMPVPTITVDDNGDDGGYDTEEKLPNLPPTRGH